jgi:AraC-like DNA-binding protein
VRAGITEGSGRSGDRALLKEPTSCIAPPIASDPRSIATNPVLLITRSLSCLASVSSPDVKMTVWGLFDETYVALECGFSDQSHFTRVFGAHTGTTPRRYAEQFCPICWDNVVFSVI